MYHYSNKTQKVQPNSFEKAVWRYATCPLEEPLPEPKTRIEQIAKEFVYDKNAATDSRKLKEINRCISVCEADANPTGLPPLEIKVSFGKSKEGPTLEQIPTEGKTNTPVSEPKTETKGSLPPLSAPCFNESSPIKDVLAYCFEVTKDPAFEDTPTTSDQVQVLITKAMQEHLTEFQHYTGPKGNQARCVLKYFAKYRDQLEEKEVEQAEREGREKIFSVRG